jgi:hypothetical protein
MTLTFEEFKRLIETDFGPTDGGMLGELVDPVENMVAGGSDLSSAITNAAQEMRDTLASIQGLGDEEIDDEEEGGDDCCDNCYTSGVDCSQTCPECGAVLCAECAAEDDGRCAQCVGNGEEVDDAEEAEQSDEASHAGH